VESTLFRKRPHIISPRRFPKKMFKNELMNLHAAGNAIGARRVGAALYAATTFAGFGAWLSVMGEPALMTATAKFNAAAIARTLGT
jgi:hypothetical protein